MGQRFEYWDSVERQLLAFHNTRFDVAIRHDDGRLEIQDELFVSQVKEITDWLYGFNRLGREILLRPHGEHGFSLLSGLSYEQVRAAKLKGFEPAVLTLYTPDRYQMWLRHDRKLEKTVSEALTRYLIERLGGDESAAHWDSFGYLAGYETQRADGHLFRVALVESEGREYSEAASIFAHFGEHR